MSTYKNIDRICAVIIVLCVLLTAFFMNGEALGLQAVNRRYGYESRLFDTSKVHTLAIVMDDWDSFLETCESEEYSLCSVVIDGDSYKNVAIRGKGNTSLSNVSSMNSQRYSFKIEFDHYDSGKSYYGLDKLSLNNIIQDNTYMKDYLAYRMMGAFGVDAPLCSYVFITVNGEDWGLYLAVEGVEDAFLQRNYGNADGDLYKPDSLSFGGGRGNGKDFNMGDFMEKFENSGESAETDSAEASEETTEKRDGFGGFGNFGDFGDMEDFGDFGGGFNGEMPEGMEFPEDMELPEGMELPEDMSFGGGGGFSGMGSSDVKLSYIDDEPSSYSSIFNNAKTDITTADQNRLIASLKTLSGYENLESVLDMEEVLRYFVVHNFVVNGDSYTGSMIHNYYLYEENGVLSMIPWDYNLAYGTFSGGAGSSSVNDPIDDVLEDRPMQAWIFSDESYTERYHALYQEFLETVDMQSLIAEADALIADYVERDPTKFCTTAEYETGVETLKSFCRLRCESVAGQLAGTIPSTSEGQQENSAALVNTDGLNISSMGTMGGTMGGGGNENRGGNVGGFGGFRRDTGSSEDTDAAPSEGAEGSEAGESNTAPGGFGGFGGDGEGMTPPDGAGSFGGFGGDGEGMTPPDGAGNFGGFSGDSESMTPPDGAGSFGGFGGDGEGMTPPDGADNFSGFGGRRGGNAASSDSEAQTETESGQNTDDSAASEAESGSLRQREQNPGGSFPTDRVQENSGSMGSTLILLGSSVFLLLLGLLFAWKYRK